MKYIEAIYDCDTDTETFVEREFTVAELAQQKEVKDARDAAQAKQIAKDALLAKLGITADEAALLLG